MLKPVIYPYKMASNSAKLLASSLNCRRVYPDRNYHPRPNHLIINWGNSEHPSWYIQGNTTQWLNYPYFVSIAANKLKTFDQLYSNVHVPEYTTNKDIAKEWVEEGHKMFCRQSLTSHSGYGIVIAETVEQLVDAPLYVQAVNKNKEYRVHVFNGQVIDYQQKKKRNDFEGGISGIRNYSNGWIYARDEVQLPEEVANESIKAVNTLSLNFGAVDICIDRDNKIYTFEINTAPGLGGLTTLQKYTEAFGSLL